jgi:hypothetical protein
MALTGEFGDPQVLYELANGRIRPTKALSDSLADLLKGNAEFILIDDQKEVYEHILAAGRYVSSVNPKVGIVEDGLGTGKTVLAINALVALMAGRHARCARDRQQDTHDSGVRLSSLQHARGVACLDRREEHDRHRTRGGRLLLAVDQQERPKGLRHRHR